MNPKDLQKVWSHSTTNDNNAGQGDLGAKTDPTQPETYRF